MISSTGPLLALAGLVTLLSCGAPKSSTSPGDSKAKPSPREMKQKAALEKLIAESEAQARICWLRGAADDIQLAGTVDLQISVGKDRKSKDVKAVSDEPADVVLTECLVELWSDVTWPNVYDVEQKVQVSLKFEAQTTQYTVASAHAPRLKLSDSTSEAWLVLNEQNTGNADASLSLLVLKPGFKEPMHTHTSAELLFITGQGRSKGLLVDLRGTRRGYKLQPFLSTAYIPAGVAHSIQQTGDQPLTALRLYAAAGPERGLDTDGSTLLTEKEVKRPARRFPRPKTRSVRAAKPVPIADGNGWARMMFEAKQAGDDAAYMGSLSLDPGTVIAEHTHPDSSEFIYMLAGEGDFTIDGVTSRVKTGDAIQIPKGVKHSFTALGEDKKKDRVKAIQFYTPSGPEQRFKAKPKKKK